MLSRNISGEKFAHNPYRKKGNILYGEGEDGIEQAEKLIPALPENAQGHNVPELLYY